MKIIKRHKIIVFILVTFLAIFFVQSLSAKCITKLYIIKGKAAFRECSDCEEFIPIEDATIVVFLDEHENGETGL